MIRSKEEILAAINARVGDDTGDEALQLLEDVTDTLADLETRSGGVAPDGETWEHKFHANDEDWRKKYKERFFSGAEIVEQQREDMDKDSAAESITFDDLFSKRES